MNQNSKGRPGDIPPVQPIYTGTGRPEDIPPAPDFLTATVGQWIEHWTEHVLPRQVAPSTVNRYRLLVRLQILPAIGDIPAAELRPRHILDLYDSVVAQGRSPRTAAMCRNVIGGSYRYAIRLELTALNPVEKVPTPRAPRRPTLPPSVAAMRTLLETARTQEHPHFTLLHVLAFTGMRRGEALALRWQNVDLETAYLRVVESAVRIAGQGTIIREPKTSGSIRTIDLDPLTVDLLAAHRDRVGTQFGSAPDLVFPDDDGGVLVISTLNRSLKALGKAAGVPGITFHQFRHFHATVALQQKQNVRVVAQRLGHTNVATTLDTYSHVLTGWQAELADSFAEAMNPGVPQPRPSQEPQPASAVAYGDGVVRGVETAHDELRRMVFEQHASDCDCATCAIWWHLHGHWTKWVTEKIYSESAKFDETKKTRRKWPGSHADNSGRSRS